MSKSNVSKFDAECRFSLPVIPEAEHQRTVSALEQEKETLTQSLWFWRQCAFFALLFGLVVGVVYTAVKADQEIRRITQELRKEKSHD